MTEQLRPPEPKTIPPPHARARTVEGPPDSFARIFLEGLTKYQRGRTTDVGSAAEEAAANLAQRTSAQKSMAGLELRSPRAIAEATAITLGLPFIGWLADPSDPFFLRYSFSWLGIAPILIALRHGFMLGFVSAAALDVTIVLAWRTRFLPIDHFPGEALVGLIVTAMIVGQFSDVWKREIVRLDAGFGVLRKQHDDLVRSQFLLELSHDRLDQQLGRNASSLREAMAAVRELAQGAKSPSYVSLGDAIMEVFAAYCMLEVGELYVVERGVLGKAVSVFGRTAGRIDPEDPLVVDALSSGRLTYVPAATLPDRDRELVHSPLLAAVPFVDTTGRVSAVLCVRAMPFISFERRNLEAMATLAGHFADVVAAGGMPSDVERGRKEVFEVKLTRALRDLQQSRTPSIVAFLWIQRGAPVADIVETLLGGALGDLESPYVTRDGDGNSFVYILLTMADEAVARGLEGRFESLTRRQLNMSLERAGAAFSFHTLKPTDSVLGIFRLFSEKAQQNEASYNSGRVR